MVFFVRITVNQSHLRPICKSTKFNPKIQRTLYSINFQQLRLHVPDFIRTVVDKEIKLVQDWDKTFPKSEKVNHEKVTFKTQYGLTLAADLYIPKTQKESCQPLP